uniref:Uncharacterized protein n=1 Tax=Glossina palpalis gambiensis TaxID=67801 RepID=A0A1B0B3X7_9MUSC
MVMKQEEFVIALIVNYPFYEEMPVVFIRDFDLLKCFIVAAEDDDVSAFSAISEVDCNSMESMHEFLVLPFESLEHNIVGVTVRTWRVLVAKVDVNRGAMVGLLIIPLSASFVSNTFPPSYIKGWGLFSLKQVINTHTSCVIFLPGRKRSGLSLQLRKDWIISAVAFRILLLLSTTVTANSN